MMSFVARVVIRRYPNTDRKVQLFSSLANTTADGLMHSILQAETFATPSL